MALVGYAMMGAAAAIFVYCTIWILFVPFYTTTLQSYEFLDKFFFDIEVLAWGPIILLVIGVVGIAGFLILKT